MTYFDEMIDVESLIEDIGEMFPLRAQFGRKGESQSPTGGMIYGEFDMEEDGVPATRAKFDSKSGRLALSTGDEVLASHIWTLPGDWTQIEKNATLREVKNGIVIGEYTVLAVDLQAHGVHTDIVTRRLA